MWTLLVFASCSVMLTTSQTPTPTTYTSVSVGKTFQDNNLHGIDLRQLLASAEQNPQSNPSNNARSFTVSPNQFLSPAIGSGYQQAALNFNPAPQQQPLIQYAPAQQFAPQPAPVQAQPLLQQYGVPAPVQQQVYSPQPAPIQPQQFVQQAYGIPAQQQNQQIQYSPQPAPVQAQPLLQQYGVPASVQQQVYSPQPAPIQPQQFVQQTYGVPAQQQNQQIQYSPQPAPAQAQQLLQQYGAPAQQQNQFQYSQQPAPVYAAPSVQYSAPAPQIAYAQQQQQPQSTIQFSLPVASQATVLPATIPASPLLQARSSNKHYGPPGYTPAPPLQSYGPPRNPVPVPVRNQAQVSVPNQSYGVPSNQQAQRNNDQPLVKKHISVHLPPPEVENQGKKNEEPIVFPKREKHYKIIFIKAPTNVPDQPKIPVVPPEPEQKTLVYVLVKKPEQAAPLVLPTPEPIKQSRPEVYFIRYKTEPVLGGVPENNQQGYENNQISVNAPAQEYGLPQNAQVQQQQQQIYLPPAPQVQEPIPQNQQQQLQAYFSPAPQVQEPVPQNQQQQLQTYFSPAPQIQEPVQQAQAYFAPAPQIQEPVQQSYAYFAPIQQQPLQQQAIFTPNVQQAQILQDFLAKRRGESSQGGYSNNNNNNNYNNNRNNN